MNEINAAASSPNCTAGFQNPWCGAKAVPLAVFTTASGLLGTSSFAQALAWVTMAAAASDVPYVGNHKYTHEVALWGHLLAAFFGMVAWANFMASGLKAEFCTTLDPDERYNGLPCGYGDGFNAAIAATVVGLVNAAAIQFWAPRGAGGTRYEFSSAAGGAGAGLTKGASDAPAGAPGAYQDFGGAASSL